LYRYFRSIKQITAKQNQRHPDHTHSCTDWVITMSTDVDSAEPITAEETNIVLTLLTPVLIG
jgi:hypothetical protein